MSESCLFRLRDVVLFVEPLRELEQQAWPIALTTVQRELLSKVFHERVHVKALSGAIEIDENVLRAF